MRWPRAIASPTARAVALALGWLETVGLDELPYNGLDIREKGGALLDSR